MQRLPLVFGLMFSASAFSQEAAKPTFKSGAQIRVEAASTSKKTEGKPGEESFAFNLKTARLIAGGEVNPNLTYTLRLDLKGIANSTKQQDGGFSALDRAYIETKPMDGVQLRFGRFPFVMGSMEADYSSIDAYLASYMLEGYSTLAPINVGVEGAYTVLGQTLVLQVTNGLKEVPELTGAQKGENIAYSLSYRGRLADGMIKPIVSYDSISRIRNSSLAFKDERVTFVAYAVGSQFSFAKVDLDLEYDFLSKPEFDSLKFDKTANAAVLVTNPEDELSTMIAQVAYNLTDLGLRPIVKYSSDVDEVAGKEALNSTRSVLALEYLPGPKGFRYHVAYTNKSDDVTGAAGKVNTTTSQLLVGVTGKL